VSDTYWLSDIVLYGLFQKSGKHITRGFAEKGSKPALSRRASEIRGVKNCPAGVRQKKLFTPTNNILLQPNKAYLVVIRVSQDVLLDVNSHKAFFFMIHECLKEFNPPTWGHGTSSRFPLVELYPSHCWF